MFTTKIHSLFGIVIIILCMLISLIAYTGNVFEIKISAVIPPYSPNSTSNTDIVVSFSNPIPKKEGIEQYVHVTPDVGELTMYFAGERLVIRSEKPLPLNTTITVEVQGLEAVQDMRSVFTTPGYDYVANQGSGTLLLSQNDQLHSIPLDFPLETMKRIEGTPNMLLHTTNVTESSDMVSILDTAAGAVRPVLELRNERILGLSAFRDGTYMLQVQRRNVADGLISVGMFIGQLTHKKAPVDFWFQAVFGAAFDFTPEGSGILGKGERSILFVPLKDSPEDILYIGKADTVFDVAHDGSAILVGTFAGEYTSLEVLSADDPVAVKTARPYYIEKAQFIPGTADILFIGNTDPTASTSDTTHLYFLDGSTQEVYPLMRDELWEEVDIAVSADGLRTLVERRRPVQGNSTTELWEYYLDTQKTASLNIQGSSPMFLY